MLGHPQKKHRLLGVDRDVVHHRAAVLNGRKKGLILPQIPGEKSSVTARIGREIDRVTSVLCGKERC